MDADKIKVEFERMRKDMFKSYMATPGTRVLMSLIPAGEKQDVLQALLETTFESGFSGGVSATSIALVGSALDRFERKG